MMSTNSNVKLIKKELEEVQARILENKQLQEKYPEEKEGLSIALATLQHLEHDIIETLKSQYVYDNFEIYEIDLKGKNLDSSIPILDLGQILIEKQEMVNSFGSKNALKKGATIPKSVINNSQLNLVATASGSFKFLLKTPQKVLFDVDNAESVVKHAFNDIKQLIEIGRNKELLEFEELRLGSKKINAYKNFLNILFEKDINLEISAHKSDKRNISVLTMESKKAKNIYNTMIEKKEPLKEDIEITGVIRGFDLTTFIHYFKIVPKKEHGEGKPIKVVFDTKFDEEVLEHVNKLSKVYVKRIINQKGIGETPTKKYHLITFIK